MKRLAVIALLIGMVVVGCQPAPETPADPGKTEAKKSNPGGPEASAKSQELSVNPMGKTEAAGSKAGN